MDTSALASEIAAKVVKETSFWVALIGLLGGIVGAVLTIAGNVLRDWMQDGPRRRLDNTRKKTLKRMLSDTRFSERWRKIGTLSRVIGADEATTKRLLIEVGARGSEQDDGLWGLISEHPFEKTAQ